MTRQVWLAGFTVLYIIAMMLLSWWAARRFVKDESEFMVGGRQFNWLLTSIGNTSILISGGYLPGIVMFGFMFGFGGWWYYIGWGTGALVALLLWASFWRESGAYTPTEWFEYRYGRAGRIAISFVILVAVLAIIGWQFVGSGETMGTALGIPPVWAMVIIGAAVVVYVALGGIWSATLTDLVQWSWVVLFNFLAIPAYLILTYGFPTPDRLPAGFLNLPFGTIPVLQLTLPSVLTFLLMHQSLLNQAPYWTRAASSLNRRQVMIGWTWTVVITYAVGFLGALTGLYVRMLMPNLSSASLALGALIDSLPIVLGACALGGLMAATMSTVDIYLVSGVNQLIRDVAQYLLKINDKQRLLALARWATIVYGGLCVIFAISWPSGLAALFGFGTAIGAPLFIYYLDSWLLKVGNRNGAISSAFASLVVVLVWDRMTDLNKIVHSLWIVFPVAFLTLVVVSLLFPERKKEEAPSAAGLTDLQKDVLGAVGKGYVTSADVMDYCSARASGLQLPAFLRELDYLIARGYLRREGERFTRQLYYELTPEGQKLLPEVLGSEEMEVVRKYGFGLRALEVLRQVQAHPGVTFHEISQLAGISFDAVGPTVNRLRKKGHVHVRGIITPKVWPTETAAGLVSEAQALA